jgi:hypothetical protein
MRLRPLAFATCLGFAALTTSPVADAFCGFYVAGADDKLVNNATMVVLMREGTRTVLSMQNNYQGPPENFAMVVPVPVVLQKENVKTLPMDVFDKVDKLASPRLVEYWEQDPCAPPTEMFDDAFAGARMKRSGAIEEEEKGGSHGVTVEAQFTVGEYEIVILSAKDSGGLDTWLREQKYTIPKGIEPILRPYVQGGSKFFVAKVNAKKVTFENGQAMLSPLRFHYDSETFALPVRLGLVNSSGMQDLVVHVLARGQRYETANYPNVAIPTNLDVKDDVRKNFPAFYAALFDRTLSRQPKAVVTEYSWDAGSCDPCPGPTLDGNDLMTFGLDALNPPAEEEEMPMKRGRSMWGGGGGGFVLTRLHLRYGKEGLGEDLVFRQAKPIVGGREFLNTDGKPETGAVESQINNFQARYAIRHAWTGPVKCANPQRGIWGGPPGGQPKKGPEAAQKLAFAKRGMDLMAFVARDDNETKIDSAPLVPAPAMYQAAPGSVGSSNGASPPSAPANAGGCAGCRVGDLGDDEVPVGTTIAVAMGAILARMLRRKNQSRA